MSKTECRIKSTKKLFTPIILEIDIITEQDLDAYLALFSTWDDDLTELLQKEKDKYEL